MNIIHNVASIGKKLYYKLYVSLAFRHEMKKIRKRKVLTNKVQLTKEQKRQIDEFYLKHYGKKIDKRWHRFYQSYTGNFCVDYFPESLFYAYLEPKLNPRKYAEVLSDKNLIGRLFDGIEGVRLPKTYAQCINGCYLIDGKLVNFEDVCQRISNLDCVIKKTTNTYGGRDVSIFEFVNGIEKLSGTSVNDVLKSFGKNFIIQEKIKQNKLLSQLNSSCVNSIRTISYIAKNNIYVAPLVLHLGRNNSKKSNAQQDGITVAISDNNGLYPFGYAPNGDAFSCHPDSKAKFAGVNLNFSDAIRQAAKKCHSRIPWLGIVGFDFTVDENLNVVVIEINVIGQGISTQYISGKSLFGENTAYMLELISRKK